MAAVQQFIGAAVRDAAEHAGSARCLPNEMVSLWAIRPE
jgi:hypothetical protein